MWLLSSVALRFFNKNHAIRFGPRFTAEKLAVMRSREEPGIDWGEPLTLGNLYRSPRSHKSKHRRRGVANGGKTCGRGTSGQKSRSNPGIPRAFQGGQTPIHKTSPKFEKIKELFKLTEVPLAVIQRWIDIGSLDPSRPITMKTLQDAGFRFPLNKVGMEISGKDVESLKSKVTIEATRFSPAAVQRIEALGGTAIAIHYDLCSRNCFLRPESYIFKNFSTFHSEYMEMKGIIQAVSPSDHAILTDEIGLHPPSLPDPHVDKASDVDVYVAPVQHKHGSVAFDPRAPSRLINTRGQIAAILESESDDWLALKLKSLLPKYSAPLSRELFQYFSDDFTRGYLSPKMLAHVGRREFEAFIGVLNEQSGLSINLEELNLDFSHLTSLYVKFGLNYWISKGHILATDQKELYDYVMSAVPGLKQVTDYERQLHEQYAEHRYYKEVDELLASKGLSYYKEEPKDHQEIKQGRVYPIKLLSRTLLEASKTMESTKPVTDSV